MDLQVGVRTEQIRLTRRLAMICICFLQNLKFGRDPTGSGLRDTEWGIFTLPTFSTKINLYCRFCYDRGWNMKITPSGKYKKVARSVESGWDASVEPQPICCWRTFLDFWNEHYSYIFIQDIPGATYFWQNSANTATSVEEGRNGE